MAVRFIAGDGAVIGCNRTCIGKRLAVYQHGIAEDLATGYRTSGHWDY
jgi:hypothetical protein